MCKPVKVEDVPKNKVRSHLIRETSKAMGCLDMKPNFVATADAKGYRLVDIEINAKHCKEHLDVVFQLLLKHII